MGSRSLSLFFPINTSRGKGKEGGGFEKKETGEKILRLQGRKETKKQKGEIVLKNRDEQGEKKGEMSKEGKI
jgi:hypothetical protein